MATKYCQVIARCRSVLYYFLLFCFDCALSFFFFPWCKLRLLCACWTLLSLNKAGCIVFTNRAGLDARISYYRIHSQSLTTHPTHTRTLSMMDILNIFMIDVVEVACFPILAAHCWVFCRGSG